MATPSVPDASHQLLPEVPLDPVFLRPSLPPAPLPQPGFCKGLCHPDLPALCPPCLQDIPASWGRLLAWASLTTVFLSKRTPQPHLRRLSHASASGEGHFCTSLAVIRPRPCTVTWTLCACTATRKPAGTPDLEYTLILVPKAPSEVEEATESTSTEAVAADMARWAVARGSRTAWRSCVSRDRDPVGVLPTTGSAQTSPQTADLSPAPILWLSVQTPSPAGSDSRKGPPPTGCRVNGSRLGPHGAVGLTWGLLLWGLASATRVSAQSMLCFPRGWQCEEAAVQESVVTAGSYFTPLPQLPCG